MPDNNKGLEKLRFLSKSVNTKDKIFVLTSITYAVKNKLLSKTRKVVTKFVVWLSTN